MKPDATLEDFQRRELFLINYIENQIRKLDTNYIKYECEESYIKMKPYMDILFKLKKDSKELGN